VTNLFDQSPAHASHGEGALNAFNMNLTPGGKDKKPQTDTYYPPECTIPELPGTSSTLSGSRVWHWLPYWGLRILFLDASASLLR
jgi:hypothetical protein